MNDPQVCIKLIKIASGNIRLDDIPGTVGGYDGKSCSNQRAGDTFILLYDKAPRFSVTLNGVTQQATAITTTSDDNATTYTWEWHVGLKQSGNQQPYTVAIGGTSKSSNIPVVGAACGGDATCLDNMAGRFAELEGRIITDPPHHAFLKACLQKFFEGRQSDEVEPAAFTTEASDVLRSSMLPSPAWLGIVAPMILAVVVIIYRRQSHAGES